MQPIINEIVVGITILAGMATIISVLSPLITNYVRGGPTDLKVKSRQKKLIFLIIGMGLLSVTTALTVASVTAPQNSQTYSDQTLFHTLPSSDLGDVEALAWSADSTRIAFIDQNIGTLEIWNALTGKQELTFQPIIGVVNSPSWSSDGKYIAINLEDKLNILEIGSTIIRSFLTINSPNLSEGNVVVAWSPDGAHIAAVFADKTIRIWKFNSGPISLFQTIKLPSGNQFNIVWSPDGKYLADESNDNTIQIWDVNKANKPFRTLYDTSLNTKIFPRNISWSPDGQMLATKNGLGNILIWSINTSNKLNEHGTLSTTSGPIAWSPDDQLIGTDFDGDLIIYKLHDFSSVMHYATPFYRLNDLEWSPNGNYIASANDKGVDVRFTRIRDYSPFGINSLSSGNNILESADLLFIGIGTVFAGLFLSIALIQEDYRYLFAYTRIQHNKVMSIMFNYIVFSIVFCVIMFAEVFAYFKLLSDIYIQIHLSYLAITSIAMYIIGISYTIIIFINYFIKKYIIVYFFITYRKSLKFMKKGKYFEKKKNYLLARENYDQVVALNPKNRKAYISRGKALKELGKLEESIDDFNQALKFGKNDECFFLRGMAHFDQKKYQKAIQDYNLAIDISGKKEYYYRRGMAYLWQKEVALARIDFIRNKELDPKDLTSSLMAIWSGLDNLRPNSETLENIAAHFDSIAEINTDNYATHLAKGVALGLRGQMKIGMQEIDTAISLSPENYEAYFWKGILTLYLYLGDSKNEKAKELIEHSLALGLPPKLLTPLYWLEKDRPGAFTQMAKPLLQQYDV